VAQALPGKRSVGEDYGTGAVAPGVEPERAHPGPFRDNPSGNLHEPFGGP
jgi:hypothetical protein